VLSVLLAQAADGAPQGGGAYSMFILVLAFFAIFYFLIMRPQAKQQKTHQAFLDKLGKGDEVVTTGGLIGRVQSVIGDVVQVEIANNVKVRVLKSQISGAFKAPEEKPAAEEPAKK
jgi:preprotein translocase subunit YajC